MSEASRASQLHLTLRMTAPPDVSVVAAKIPCVAFMKRGLCLEKENSYCTVVHKKHVSISWRAREILCRVHPVEYEEPRATSMRFLLETIITTKQHHVNSARSYHSYRSDFRYEHTFDLYKLKRCLRCSQATSRRQKRRKGSTSLQL